MSIIHGHLCDFCGETDPDHPDNGTPSGWYLLAKMSGRGTWESTDERHLCSQTCLVVYVSAP